MAIGRVNTGGGGTGGTLRVIAPAGVTVTAAKDGKTYTRTANAQGVAVFKGLSTGIWAVTISDGVQNPTTQNIQITADYEMTIAFFAATITVTYPAGSVCTCSKGATVLTAPDTSGRVVFTVPEIGLWNISITDGTENVETSVSITEDGQNETVSISYQLYITDFDLTVMGALGTDYEIVYDDDTTVDSSDYATAKNWKIRLLTSNAKAKPLKDGKIDVFAVGGGGQGHSRGGGGGGGYTETLRSLKIIANTEYPVTIGGGGGNTTAFGITAASGGNAADNTTGPGAAGGSGGGGSAASASQSAGDGGSDGADGGAGGRGAAGTGQGTTTREFGEPNGKLYAGGGGGAGFNGAKKGAGGEGGGGAGGGSNSSGGGTSTGEAGEANTGGGSGGGWGMPPLGGSGIVVIRNARG